ncbi:MAG: hypothetical protein AABY22_37105, partial [Nanoarchaeota archaeon]
TNVVIDTECVGDIIEDNKVQIAFYGETTVDDDVISSDIFPQYSPYFKLDELIAEGLPEKTLQEFMGSRFGYNTRILSNMNIIKKELGVKVV